MADTIQQLVTATDSGSKDSSNPIPAGNEISPETGSQSSTPKEKKTGPRPPSKQQQLNKLYALPAPLRTFPLPTLVPHNPLSLFHILYVWLSQTVKPSTSHFEPLYHGWFSPETRSVHITDERAIRGLWEQGFYGKGSLSRSEPSWLKRETTRLGAKGQATAEERTRQRRAERQQTKWERARKEREAIDQKLLEEAEAEKSKPDNLALEPVEEIAEEFSPEPSVEVLPEPVLSAPVGPLELLALPNSFADLEASMNHNIVSCTIEDLDRKYHERFYRPPIGPLELLALPNKLPAYLATPFAKTNGHADYRPTLTDQVAIESSMPQIGSQRPVEENEVIGGSETNEDTGEGSTHSDDTEETASTTPNGSAMANGSSGPPGIKRQKSVRFSPTVEKNTFISSDPPSPQQGEVTTPTIAEAPLVIKQQEHTQLTLEEAFFLSYGLGALQILHPQTKQPMSNQDLFSLFRQISYFPPVANQSLSPDDPFMVNYVVYHHYRSLGWVPRGGIKFSVDLMLYVRGPVFTHAEYGVLILPSYSDPYWSSDVFLQKYVKSKEQRTWHWISCINRVITQVKKTLILTYVDIPPPLGKGEEEKLGIDKVLARYKVREIVLKRWVANRSRD